jgi:hypothetical protein
MTMGIKTGGREPKNRLSSGFRSMKVVLGLFALYSAAVYAGAYITGNFLYDSQKAVGKELLLGYVAGIHDSYYDARLFCKPDNVPLGQAVDVVAKYLNDHPEKRHLEAQLLVVVALTEAWPCKK